MFDISKIMKEKKWYESYIFKHPSELNKPPLWGLSFSSASSFAFLMNVISFSFPFLSNIVERKRIFLFFTLLLWFFFFCFLRSRFGKKSKGFFSVIYRKIWFHSISRGLIYNESTRGYQRVNRFQWDPVMLEFR